MTWKEIFTSSIGRKFVMGLTGLFLILFLIVHVAVNAMIFAVWFGDDGMIFNEAAHFMGSNVLVRTMEIGLFAGFLLHIIQGLILEFDNRTKRKTGYAIPLGNRGSRWYSRWMGLLGTLILLFLVIHLWHFWVPARVTGHEELTSIAIGSSQGHDMFNLMKHQFQVPWVVIVYVLACISLAYHLLHGFQSAFRTFGLRNQRWLKIVQGLGVAFSLIVPLVFAMMPISMYLGWIQ